MKTARLALLLFGAAVLALPAGCQKGLEEKTGGSSSGIPADYDGLTATIEQGQKDCSNILGDEEFDEAVTKTALTGNDYICWSEGDKIFVNGTATANTLTVVPFGIEATTAALNGSVTANTNGRKYCGYYPASTTYWTVTASAKQVKLPSSITYDASSPLGNVPMYAESDNGHLVFKPLFGLLELTFTGNRTIKTIKLSASEKISGSFSIGSSGELTYVSGGSNSVSVDIGSGFEANDIRPIKIYIALPSISLTNLVLTITSDNTEEWGGVYSKKIDALEVRRGTLYASAMKTATWEGFQFWEGGPYWRYKDVGAATDADMGDYFAYGATVKVYTLGSKTTRSSGGKTYPRYNLSFTGTNPNTGIFPRWNASKGFAYINTPFCTADTPTFSDYATNGDVLALTHDAARVQLGGTWRMPTKEEGQKLVANVTYTHEVDLGGGKIGSTLTGKTTWSGVVLKWPYGYYGSGLFLDTNSSSGELRRGWFWLSTSRGGNSAWTLDYTADGRDVFECVGNYKQDGFRVRAVKDL